MMRNVIYLVAAIVFISSSTARGAGDVKDHHDCNPAGVHQSEASPGWECVNFVPGGALAGIPGATCWTDWPGPAVTQMFCTASGCSIGGTLDCAGGGQSYSMWCPAVDGELPMVEAQKTQSMCFGFGPGTMLTAECGNNGHAYIRWQ